MMYLITRKLNDKEKLTTKVKEQIYV